jgi:uncharacterized protein (TIGR04255 family)
LLWQGWRDEYPIVDEVPPLDPAIEREAPGMGATFQITSVPPMMRYWFLSEDQSRLIQLQRDRLILNWRKVPTGPQTYPRYAALREEFVRRIGQLVDFLSVHNLGDLAMTQAELNYINSLPVGQGFDGLGQLHRVLRTLAPVEDSLLSEPEEVRISHVYRVDSEAGSPARCYIVMEPRQDSDEEPSLLLTLTVRGKPFGEDVAETMKFLDFGHNEIVRRFTEATTEVMHASWGRTR